MNMEKENVYKIILKGKRDTNVIFDTERMVSGLNVMEIIDETVPAYDFERLYEEHKETILGRYIDCFRGCGEESIEYQALYEGGTGASWQPAVRKETW